MSKEVVRQLVETRFSTFTFGDIDNTRKSYPNMPNTPIPNVGRWVRLQDIQFVLNKIVGIGSKPCTRRTGVIVIDVYERLDVGTRKIIELTDAVEQHFGLWTATNFWTEPANTNNFPNDGDKNLHYRSRVLVPFVYDEY